MSTGLRTRWQCRVARASPLQTFSRALAAYRRSHGQPGLDGGLFEVGPEAGWAIDVVRWRGKEAEAVRQFLSALPKAPHEKQTRLDGGLRSLEHIVRLSQGARAAVITDQEKPSQRSIDEDAIIRRVETPDVRLLKQASADEETPALE